MPGIAEAPSPAYTSLPVCRSIITVSLVVVSTLILLIALLLLWQMSANTSFERIPDSQIDFAPSPR